MSHSLPVWVLQCVTPAGCCVCVQCQWATWSGTWRIRGLLWALLMACCTCVALRTSWPPLLWRLTRYGPHLRLDSLVTTEMSWIPRDIQNLQQTFINAFIHILVELRNQSRPAILFQPSSKVYHWVVSLSGWVKLYRWPACVVASWMQHGISSMLWDPSGHLLATCATETQLKLWSHTEDSLMCGHHLQHRQPVCHMAWCTTQGKTEAAFLMLAWWGFQETIGFIVLIIYMYLVDFLLHVDQLGFVRLLKKCKCLLGFSQTYSCKRLAE